MLGLPCHPGLWRRGGSVAGRLRRLLMRECARCSRRPCASCNVSPHAADRAFAATDTVNAIGSLEELALDEPWLIKRDDIFLHHERYSDLDPLDRFFAGSFHATPVAVKMPKSNIRGCDIAGPKALTNELRVLRQVRHRNIVLLDGAFMRASCSRIALVLEHVKLFRLDLYIHGRRIVQSTESYLI